MIDTYGLTYFKLLANYDHRLSCWRMSEDISASDSKKFLQTLPTSGMTVSGKLFRRPTLVLRMKELDYSLLLTPTAAVGEFHHRLRNLPTPQARDHKGASTRGVDLNAAIVKPQLMYRTHWIAKVD